MANNNLGHGLFVRRGGKGSDDPSGTSPREARKALAGLFEVTGLALKPREGVLIGGNKNLLYGSASGMQIGVRPFTMGLARQKDGADGLILMANTDVSLIDIDPAPAAGPPYRRRLRRSKRVGIGDHQLDAVLRGSQRCSWYPWHETERAPVRLRTRLLHGHLGVDELVNGVDHRDLAVHILARYAHSGAEPGGAGRSREAPGSSGDAHGPKQRDRYMRWDLLAGQ